MTRIHNKLVWHSWFCLFWRILYDSFPRLYNWFSRKLPSPSAKPSTPVLCTGIHQRSHVFSCASLLIGPDSKLNKESRQLAVGVRRGELSSSHLYPRNLSTFFLVFNRHSWVHDYLFHRQMSNDPTRTVYLINIFNNYQPILILRNLYLELRAESHLERLVRFHAQIYFCVLSKNHSVTI